MPSYLVDTPPTPVETVMPVYPERALKERSRGLVVLKVLVSESGSPLEVTVQKEAAPELTAAAIAAARQWRFEPARKGGRAVRSFATVRFPFEGVQFARTPGTSAPSVPAAVSPPPTPRPRATRTPAAAPFLPPGRVDARPRPIEKHMPVYPPSALKERVRGLVVLKVLVSESGLPLAIKVEQEARADLTAAAVAAARQWRFEPARKDGRPVRTFTIVRFAFEGVEFAVTPLPEGGDSDVPQPTETKRPS